MRKITSLDKNAVFPWHRELNELLLLHWLTGISSDSRIVAALFGVSWFFAIIFYAALHKPLFTIGQQHNHTLKVESLILFI